MMSAKSVAMLMMAMIVIMGMENILVQANRPLCELSGGCELSPSPSEDTPISPSPSEDLFGVTPDESPLTLQDFHLTKDSLSLEDESPFDVNPDCRRKKKKKKKHHRHSPAPAPSPSEDLFGDVSPLTLQDFHLTEDSLSSEDENPFDVNPDCRRKKKKKKKKHHRHSPAPAPSPSEDLFGDVSPLTLQDFHLTEEDSLSLEDENPFDVNPDCRKKKKKKKKKHHRHSPSPAPAPSRFDFSINSMSSSPKSPKSPETPKSESWKSEGNTFFCMFGCSMHQCFHLGKDPKDVDRFDSCVVNCLETCNKKK